MQSISDCYNRLEARVKRHGRTLPLPENTFLKKILRGSQSIADAGRLSSKNFTNCTWEMFIKINTTNSSYGIYGKSYHSWAIISAGDILLRATIGGATAAQTLTDYSIRNRWMRFSVVVNGSRLTSYIDGEVVTDGTYSGALSVNTNTYNVMGVDTVNGGETLEMADFRIWSVARTQQEIKGTLGLYAIRGPTTGLETCLEFSNISGDTIKDISGNGWDLTGVDELLKRTGVVKL